MSSTTQVKRSSRIPRFKSRKEEAKFWATHSAADYWDRLVDPDEVLALAPSLADKIRRRMRKRLVAIRLEEWQIARTKSLARRKGMRYQQLLREWITRGIRAEHSKSNGSV